MSAHTPGPWFCGDDGRIWRRPVHDLYQYGGTVAGDAPLATVNSGHSSWEHKFPVEANARLIAAAPELLEALRALLPFAEHSEGCGDHDAYNGADVPTCGCGLDSTIAFVRDALIKATGEPA